MLRLHAAENNAQEIQAAENNAQEILAIDLALVQQARARRRAEETLIALEAEVAEWKMQTYEFQKAAMIAGMERDDCRRELLYTNKCLESYSNREKDLIEALENQSKKIREYEMELQKMRDASYSLKRTSADTNSTPRNAISPPLARAVAETFSSPRKPNTPKKDTFSPKPMSPTSLDCLHSYKQLSHTLKARSNTVVVFRTLPNNQYTDNSLRVHCDLLKRILLSARDLQTLLKASAVGPAKVFDIE